MIELIGYIFITIIFLIQILIEVTKLFVCFSPLIYACYILTEDDPSTKKSNKETRAHPYIAGGFILVWIYVTARVIYSFCKSWIDYFISLQERDIGLSDVLYGYGSPETWHYPVASLSFILITRIIYNKIIGAKSELS
jgi:hypothetical protein